MNNRLRFTLQAPLFWSLSLFLALLIGGPLFVIFSALGNPQPEIWEHLWSYVLPEAFVNTLWLLLGVGLGVLFLGISLAWITTQYSFPGHRFFAWALMLPLAIPGYVMATVYLRFLDYSGPVFVLIRSTWGNVNWHLPIQSVGGCIIVLVLALYPYVYLVTRNAFLTQGQQIMESAQMLGMKPLQAFFKGVIPAARPWWLAGLTLALMETVADFGTVSSFNYPTFTTAIYKIWVGMFNPIAALQLSAVLLGFVLILLMLKQFAEQGKFCSNRYFRSKQSLHGWRAWCATLWCALVWLLAFLFPIMQLLIWVAQSYTEVWTDRYIDFMTNSLVLAISSALILMVLGLCLALMDRYARGTLWRGMITIATLGYAIPGLVLGVGLIEPIYKAIALLNRQSPQVAQLLQDS